MDVCCAAGKPISHDYKPQGTLEALGPGLEGYVIKGTKPAALVVLSDIFGYEDYPQIKQFADALSSATGFTVAVPDPFHGQPWPMSKMPPKPEDDLPGWIARVGSYVAVSKDVNAAVAYLKGQGAQRLGILGACWGTAIAMEACAQPGTPFGACGGVHPSLFGREVAFAEAMLTPVALVAAKGDPLEAVQAVLDSKPALGPKCAWRRMDDMVHGFCAARGDFADPAVVARVEEAVALLAGFFKANLE